jgi:predicted PurR-regulated permease PerM
MLETPFMRFLLAAACIVIIVAGIKALSAALIIVLFAILIAQCIHPLTVWLRTKKISSLFAVIITGACSYHCRCCSHFCFSRCRERNPFKAA